MEFIICRKQDTNNKSCVKMIEEVNHVGMQAITNIDRRLVTRDIGSSRRC